MKLKSVLFCFSMMFSVAVSARDSSHMDFCYDAILQAEQQRNPQVYSQCGFDDVNYAVVKWASWAKENNAYQAMYELCMRHPNHRESANLCELAVLGGNGSALLNQGNKQYAEKNYIQALQSFTQALRSPLLTDEEKGQISEKIGTLYLDKNSTYYNPKKGLPLIEKATQQRSALANNIIGVYSMLGLEGQKVNMEKSFEYLWRSVLLGCSNAEENLGLFYLLHQNKITSNDVRKLVSDKILTCQSDNEKKELSDRKYLQSNCDCEKTKMMEELVSRYPYRLISVEADKTAAILKDENNRQFSVSINSVLPNGAVVNEIRKTAVILLNNRVRQTLNLAPDEACVEYCFAKQKVQTSDLPNVEPYHLSFTPSECSSILYYAERLVDTNLPFVGKQECGYSGDLDAATQLLLQ